MSECHEVVTRVFTTVTDGCGDKMTALFYKISQKYNFNLLCALRPGEKDLAEEYELVEVSPKEPRRSQNISPPPHGPRLVWNTHFLQIHTFFFFLKLRGRNT